MRIAGLCVLLALAMPAGASAVRAPEREPFALPVFEPACTGEQSVRWTPAGGGRFTATISGGVDCVDDIEWRNGCGVEFLTRHLVTQAERLVASSSELSNTPPYVCEPEPLTVKPFAPAGSVLIARYRVSLDSSLSNRLFDGGPTVFCPLVSNAFADCKNDIQMAPGEDITIRFR